MTRRFIRKFFAITEGFVWAGILNIKMLISRIAGKKNLVIQIGAVAQLMHVEPVLRKIISRGCDKNISFYILTVTTEIEATQKYIKDLHRSIDVGSVRSERLLVFCDFMLSVDQGAVFPLIGCKTRACSFHGQPSKGNTYETFNYKRINALFLYGPLMRDYYLRTKASHPEWPEIKLFEPEGNDGSYIFIATLFTCAALPSMVLAWRERDI